MDLLQHKIAVLERAGIPIAKDANILDFGCGTGATVVGAVRKGFINCRGFDIRDYLSDVARSDIALFSFNDFAALPYADNTFDLVVSDQVFEHVQDQWKAFSEIFRVLKPGAHAVHVIPARYQIIEPHIYVPFGGLIGAYWYYKFWAVLGIRCESQRGSTSDQVAENNTATFVTNLRYIGNSNYKALWRKIGYTFYFAELEYMSTSEKPKTRKLGKLARMCPPVLWAIRTLWARVVIMSKPTSYQTIPNWPPTPHAFVQPTGGH